MAKILIAENNISLSRLINKKLCMMGHECIQLFDGTSLLREIAEEKPELVVLNPGLPGFVSTDADPDVRVSGMVLLTPPGAAVSTPGLHADAKEYFAKPVDIMQLISGCDRLLKKKKKPRCFAFDDITVNLDKKRVFKSGTEVALTPREFSLLETFVINRNMLLSRRRLIQLGWQFDYAGNVRTVDVHVQRLRRKLGIKERIRTVYKLNDSYLCTDLLAAEKHASHTYDTCIFEFKDKNVRNILNLLPKQEQGHGEVIYNYMSINGMC